MVTHPRVLAKEKSPACSSQMKRHAATWAGHGDGVSGYQARWPAWFNFAVRSLLWAYPTPPYAARGLRTLLCTSTGFCQHRARAEGLEQVAKILQIRR